MKKVLPILLTAVILLSVSCSKKEDTDFEMTETVVTEAFEETFTSETEKSETETEEITTRIQSTTAPTVRTTVTTTEPSTREKPSFTLPQLFSTTRRETTSFTVTAPTQQTKAAEPYYDTDTAEEILRRTNEQRRKHFLEPLVLSEELCEAAKIRSYEISIRFSHTRPDGSSCDTVYTQDIGENIAYGQSSYDEVFSAWMNSSGHRKNILREDYTEMGACCYIGSDGVRHWVQIVII